MIDSRLGKMQFIIRHGMNSIINSRLFHTSKWLNIDPSTVEEVRIPVPWGYIAGKWWGSKNIQPIIAIHGWLDNAGSWDPFANALPENFSLLAIDAPGYGLSSRLPPFQNYSAVNFLSILSRIKKYYNLDKLSLLGHSGGSAVCFFYSALFPEDVSNYFGIDYVIYAYKDELKRAETIGKLMDTKILLALCDPNKAKHYTYEEAQQRWITATKGSVTKKSAEILMRRGTNSVAGGNLLLSRDYRTKGVDIDVVNTAQACVLAENIKCDVTLVKSTKSKFFENGIKHFPDILNIIEKKAKSFKLHIVEGNHHLHMDSPDKIVELYLDMVKNVKI